MAGTIRTCGTVGQMGRTPNLLLCRAFPIDGAEPVCPRARRHFVLIATGTDRAPVEHPVLKRARLVRLFVR